jgi:hypothetical protein
MFMWPVCRSVLVPFVVLPSECMFMWPVCRSVVVPFVVLPSECMFIWPVCRSVVVPAHRPYKRIILYTIYSICISSNSDESKKLPDDGRPLRNM